MRAFSPVAILVIGLALVGGFACGGGSDSESTSEQISDTDSESQSDVDGDSDAESQSEAPCRAGSDSACFNAVDTATTLNGDHTYVKASFQTHTCSMDGSSLTATFYAAADSRTTLSLQVLNYSTPQTYSGESNVVVKWTFNDTTSTANFRSTVSFPCSITLSDKTTGTFVCTVLDMNDNGHTVALTGAFSCTIAAR